MFNIEIEKNTRLLTVVARADISEYFSSKVARLTGFTRTERKNL